MVGSTVYCFGLYLVPLSEAFGLSRGQTSLGMIALSSGIMAWSPFVGRLLDRIDAKRIMALGGVMLSLGLCIIGVTNSTAVLLFAIVGPLSIAMVCCGPLAGSTVVARWFQRRRGRALGFVAVSTSAGGFVMQPLGAQLITNLGWRNAMVTTGVGAGLLIVLLATFVVRSSPSQKDLRAGGEVLEGDASESGFGGEERIWTARELLRSPTFWLIAWGVGILLGSDQALVATMVPYLQDIGFELQTAALLVAFQSGSAITGKVALGLMADRVSLQRLFAVVALAHLILLAALIMKPGYWILLSVVISAGLAIGGVFPLLTMFIATAFGSRSYGTAYGVMNAILQVFAMGGGLLCQQGARPDG